MINRTNGIIVSMRAGKELSLEKAFLEYVPDEYVLNLHVRTKTSTLSMYVIVRPPFLPSDLSETTTTGCSP